MIKKAKSSTLLSIFKRKGGEGEFTKIVNTKVYDKFSDMLSVTLRDDEKGLILCYLGFSKWTFLTNQRLFYKRDSIAGIIDNNNIKKVSLAIDDEFRFGVKDKKEFTRLLLKEKEGKNHLLLLESGEPFEGFYQVLHFISIQRNG
ncbi:MAG: hypothetical protein OIF50_02420 [Flavobacteriaceae bacterium]|nr:hypothetical protein [Flavobacteriaceae bacterium]